MITLKKFYLSFLRKYEEIQTRIRLIFKERNRKKLLILTRILTCCIFLLIVELWVLRPRREGKPAFHSADLTQISPTPTSKSLGRFTVNIPPNAIGEKAVMNMMSVPRANPSGYLQGIETTLFSVESVSGNFITSFLKPISIVVTYTDEELKKCNFDENLLGVYISENLSDGDFKKLPASLDKENNILEAQTDNFSSEQVFFTLAAPLPPELAVFLDYSDKEELEIREGRVIFKSEGYSLWFPESWRVGLVGAYRVNLGFKTSIPIDGAEWVYLLIYNNFKGLKLNELEKLTYIEVPGEIPLVEKDETIKEKNELTLGERKTLFLKTSKGNKNIFRYFLVNPFNFVQEKGWEIVHIFEVEILKGDTEITRANSQILSIVEEMIKSMEFFKASAP